MRTRRSDASEGASPAGAAAAEGPEKGCICGAAHPETPPADDDERSPPSTKRKRGGSRSAAEETFWLQCDGPCSSWYHVSSTCVGFPSAMAASDREVPRWFCVECVMRDDGSPRTRICRSEEEVDLYHEPSYPLIVALNYPLWYASKRARTRDDDDEDGDGGNGAIARDRGKCTCGSSHDGEESAELFWLQCDGPCRSWYRNAAECAGVTEGEAKVLETWICTRCCGGASASEGEPSVSGAAAGGDRRAAENKGKQGGEFRPGHVCKDAVFYCTLDDETCADVAAKLGTNWRNVAIANKDRYGKIKPASKFEERTLLLLPKKRDPAKIEALRMRAPKVEDPPEEKEIVRNEKPHATAAGSTEHFPDAEDLNVKPGQTDPTGLYYCTLDDESCAIVAQKLGCEWQDLAGTNRERYGRIAAHSRFEERTVLTIPRPERREAGLVECLSGGSSAKPLVSPSPPTKPPSAAERVEADTTQTDESKAQEGMPVELADSSSTKPKSESDAGNSDAAVETDEQNERFYPGFVCKDMLYYATLDNETPRRCAAKLGCQCKDLVALNAGTYKGLKATSQLQEGTVLEIPLAKTAAAIKKLEALYRYEDKLDFCCECFLVEERGGPPMLLCDGCDAACHLPCAFPGLTEAPEGDWFCKKCTTKREKEAEKEGGK